MYVINQRMASELARICIGLHETIITAIVINDAINFCSFWD
jgi:hypothetical protein